MKEKNRLRGKGFLLAIKNKMFPLWQWLKLMTPKKRWSYVLSIVFLSIVVVGLFGRADNALADINDVGWWNNLLSGWMFTISTLFMKLAIFFLEFFINLAKYNDYIKAPTVIVGWLMVRDVANMFFVVVLLVIAIGTILGLEQYEWKKTLGKFVLAAILINFSKMIFGLVIDVAHVFTITFLNAVSAIAGGNLINMFNFQDMAKMLSQTPEALAGKGNFPAQIFSSAVLSVFLTALAAMTIGAYTIVMMARVVVLWVLIILSPLAFILQIIPQTQSYAKQIWDKFAKQVMVAPIMVFFLWLAFATLGAGNNAQQFGITDTSSISTQAAGSFAESGGTADQSFLQNAVALSEASTWSNLANFMISIAFLIVGINVVQQMGVVGGGLIQRAQDFAGSVAKIATGYALGRKLVGGATDLGKRGLLGGGKGILKHMPFGGEYWKDTGKKIAARSKILWKDKIGRGNVPLLSGWARSTARRKKRLAAWEEGAETAMKVLSKEQSAGIAGDTKRRLKGELSVAEARSAARDKAGEDEAAIAYMQKTRMKDGKPTDRTWLEEQAMYETDRDTRESEKKALIAGQKKTNREKAVREFEEKAKQTAELDVTLKSENQIRLEKERGEQDGIIETIQSNIRKSTEVARKRVDDEFDPSIRAARAEIDGAERDKDGFLESNKDLEFKEQAERIKRIDLEIEQLTEQLKTPGLTDTEAQKIKSRIKQKQKDKEDVSVATILAGIDKEIAEQVGLSNNKKLSQKDRDLAIDKLNQLAERRRLYKPLLDKEQAISTARQKLKNLSDKKEKEMKEIDAGQTRNIAENPKIQDAKKRVAEIDDELGQERAVSVLSLAKGDDDVEEYKREHALPYIADESERLQAERQLEREAMEHVIAQRLVKQNKEIRKKEEIGNIPESDRTKVLTLDEARIQAKAKIKAKIERDLAAAYVGGEMDDDVEEYKRMHAHGPIADPDKRKAADKELEQKARLYAIAKRLQSDDSSLSQADAQAQAQAKLEEFNSRGYVRGYSTGGAKATVAELRAESEEKGLQAAKDRAKKEALEGVDYVRSLFDKTQVSQVFSEAAEKFIDKIKQAKIQDIFAKGLKDLQNLKDLKISGDDKAYKQAQSMLSPGALHAQAVMAQKYAEEYAGISKGEAADEADSQFSKERYGFYTPASAFKNLIKKKMEEFQGVEREQAVDMAMGTASLLMAKKDRGEKLDRDQEAMMQAGMTYLTKQAWSDDMLSALAVKMRNNRAGKMTGRDREEVDVLEKVFIHKLHWGKINKDTKQLEIINQSSNVRTNDLHRLLAYAGDYKLKMREDAITAYMDSTGKSFKEAISDMAKKITASIGGMGKENFSNVLGGDGQVTDQLAGLLKDLGMESKDELEQARLADNLKAFISHMGDNSEKYKAKAAEKLKIGVEALDFNKLDHLNTVAGSLVDSLIGEISQFTEANQMLADAKNVALQNAHLDDGGHTIYDAEAGIFRGQSAKKAMSFILSDWRKLGATERARRLKIHSVAQMDEDYNFIRIDRGNSASVRETFNGMDTELTTKDIDGRNRAQLSGRAADEEAIMEKGKMVLNHVDCVMSQALGGQQEALTQIMTNFSVLLNNATVPWASIIGKESGLSFNESSQGGFNLAYYDEVGRFQEIKDVDKLMDAIEKYADKSKAVKLDKSKIKQIFDGQRRKFQSGGGKGKNKGAMYEEPVDDDYDSK